MASATVNSRPPLIPALLVPATALAVALGPAVAAPPVPARPALPTVHVEAVQLAGIGQNIYNAITPVVQYVVGGVSYLINAVPLAGPIIAAQINIDYFQGIQPAVAATVDYAAALLHAPLDFFPITRAYLDTLVGIQYNLVSAQLRFLGFNELPPRPGAATRAPRPRVAAPAAVAANPAGTATPDATPEVTPEVAVGADEVAAAGKAAVTAAVDAVPAERATPAGVREHGRAARSGDAARSSRVDRPRADRSAPRAASASRTPGGGAVRR